MHATLEHASCGSRQKDRGDYFTWIPCCPIWLLGARPRASCLQGRRWHHAKVLILWTCHRTGDKNSFERFRWCSRTTRGRSSREDAALASIKVDSTHGDTWWQEEERQDVAAHRGVFLENLERKCWCKCPVKRNNRTSCRSTGPALVTTLENPWHRQRNKIIFKS